MLTGAVFNGVADPGVSPEGDDSFLKKNATLTTATRIVASTMGAILRLGFFSRTRGTDGICEGDCSDTFPKLGVFILLSGFFTVKLGDGDGIVRLLCCDTPASE